MTIFLNSIKMALKIFTYKPQQKHRASLFLSRSLRGPPWETPWTWREESADSSLRALGQPEPLLVTAGTCSPPSTPAACP